eukprot:gnl/TRDRNA2_/TRDRNA2_35183_c0_seq1.p1 gnl/TRDRNA2_/TRDRNA2_35183_c0~~gnl/TRDRNA2_/TRDRNA2_35183_c0_seq1.p1  ORF type:complete len:246 (-),score=32.64 gnl/TRDRNA2_/TRDRNA2_35183_c0_seq1:46-783(-)
MMPSREVHLPGLDMSMPTFEDQKRPRAASPSSSTTASGNKSSPRGSPASSPRELPALPLPDGVHVRVSKTFIHISGPPGLGDVSERIVQTMPCDMFRHFLQTEPREPISPSAFPVPDARMVPAVPVHAEEEPLATGTEVVIEGLVKLPDFNGQRCVVQSLDKESGRYSVLLADTRVAKIKRGNLRLAIPPPPSYAPRLCLDECIVPEAGQGEFDVPRTPMWAEDFSCQAGGRLTAPLRLPLTALV